MNKRVAAIDMSSLPPFVSIDNAQASAYPISTLPDTQALPAASLSSILLIGTASTSSTARILVTNEQQPTQAPSEPG